MYQNMKHHYDKEYLNDSGNAFLESNTFPIPENISASASIHMTQISGSKQMPLMQSFQLENTSFSSHNSSSNIPLPSSSFEPSSKRLVHNQNQFNSKTLQDSLHYVPSMHEKVGNMKSPKR